jgi:hypothetical protein
MWRILYLFVPLWGSLWWSPLDWETALSFRCFLSMEMSIAFFVGYWACKQDRTAIAPRR